MQKVARSWEIHGAPIKQAVLGIRLTIAAVLAISYIMHAIECQVHPLTGYMY